MNRDGIAIGIGERKSASERAIRRRCGDRYAGRGKFVVQCLAVIGLHPEGNPGPGVGSNRLHVYAGKWRADSKGDWLCREENDTRWGAGCPLKTQLVLVELCRALHVQNLQSHKVWSCDGHDLSRFIILVHVSVLTRTIVCKDIDMSQASGADKLDRSLGYVLKQTATALRGSMDAVLRPLGLTLPQYACLELLEQRPDSSNADLARGAFVTRQSMNQVLRGLQERGLVTRPAVAAQGRALPARITSEGRQILQTANVEVSLVETRMLSGLSAEAQERLLGDLAACTQALTEMQPAVQE